MRIKRWTQLERFGSSGEVPEAEQAPFLAPFICHCKLIARDMERGALQPFCGLDPDQALPFVRIKTGDIVDYST